MADNSLGEAIDTSFIHRNVMRILNNVPYVAIALSDAGTSFCIEPSIGDFCTTTLFFEKLNELHGVTTRWRDFF